MADAEQARRLQLDLNSEVFQENWLTLDKSERNRVTDTLRKLRQLTWEQLYRDQDFTQSRRASAYRDGNFLRFLTIAPDHDAAYGKK